jgi:hypothetical protein
LSAVKRRAIQKFTVLVQRDKYPTTLTLDSRSGGNRREATGETQ